MIFSFVTGIFGFVLLMGIWFAVQAWARAHSRCARDHDMLEGHGCGACNHLGACSREERKHHGPA
jgi:hypothetical protein